ncbi:MAG: thioether cross-link-forming SCIFF peptide maturase [Caldisericaceae bacterium]
MDQFDKSLIHIFSFNGEYFALDVNSGTLLNIDGSTHFFLQELLNEQSLEKAETATKREFGGEASNIRAEIEQLIDEKSLFSEPPEYFQSELVLKSMCLNVAHSCNFACKYCFAKKGSYGGNDEIMSQEIARKSIDYLHDNSPARETLEIDFFGGEPFLAFETVRSTIEYARNKYKDKKWRFTITTNGSLLTQEREQFLYDNDVSIVLSLDGDKKTNDKYRLLKNGDGTFDIIIDKIKKVAEHRSESQGYYVRGTYTHTTLDISKTVLDLHNFGFKYISLEPVVTDESGIAIEKSDLNKLRKEYERLAEEYVNSQKQSSWTFFHFNVDLEAGPCIQKRINGCGAGVEYVAVAPNGDIYPCHQFDGIEETKLGDIYSGITNKELQEQFRKANYLFNKPECANCWARFYCSGGCLANNYTQNGDIFKPYAIGCEIQKMRIEAALYVQYKLRELGIEVPTTQLQDSRDIVR